MVEDSASNFDHNKNGFDHNPAGKYLVEILLQLARPNIKAMKNIKAYCEKNCLPYEDVEEAWLNFDIKRGNKQ